MRYGWGRDIVWLMLLLPLAPDTADVSRNVGSFLLLCLIILSHDNRSRTMTIEAGGRMMDEDDEQQTTTKVKSKVKDWSGGRVQASVESLFFEGMRVRRRVPRRERFALKNFPSSFSPPNSTKKMPAMAAM